LLSAKLTMERYRTNRLLRTTGGAAAGRRVGCGYSRLIGIDEEGTLARLKAVRKTLVDPTIAARIPSSDFRFWHFRTCRDSQTMSAHRGKADIPPQRRSPAFLDSPQTRDSFVLD
jgi:hypothetical protein